MLVCGVGEGISGFGIRRAHSVPVRTSRWLVGIAAIIGLIQSAWALPEMTTRALDTTPMRAAGHYTWGVPINTIDGTGSLTVKGTGSILVEIDDASAGLLLPNDAAALVVEQVPDGEGGVAIQGTVTIRFTGTPVGEIGYGLCWGGDRREVLESLLDDGRLTIDSGGLLKEAVIFYRGGTTSVGPPPSAGSLFLIR